MNVLLLILGLQLVTEAPACEDYDAAVGRVATLRLSGELDPALALATRTLDCKTITPPDSVKVLVEISRIHDRFGLHDNSRPVAAALEAIERAAGMAAEAGEPSVALVDLALADYHYRAEMSEREFPTATRHARAAIRLFEKLGDRRNQADAVHKLGLIHLQRRELKRARELFELSLELDTAAGARVWFCGEYHRHVAMIDGLEGDHESSIPHYRRSLECRVEAGAIDASLFAAVSLAGALIRVGRPAEAAEQLQYAIGVARLIDSPVGLVRAHMTLARMHEALGDVPAARAAFAEAKRLAQSVNASSTAQNAEDALKRLAAGP